LAWEPATARRSSRVADRLPTLAAAPVPKSTGGVPVRIVELFGPVVTDESDPLFMGADGHSNNTGELQAVAEALLWLKDTERSLSPVLFCLDSKFGVRCECHSRD
jgi:hypothetical protein